MTEGSILAPKLHERACRNCLAWAAWGSIAVVRQDGDVIGHRPTGQCRFHPPRPGKAEAYGEHPAIWPIVNALDWCLEFQRAEP